MKIGMIVVVVVVLFVVVMFGWAMGARNTLVTERESVTGAWSARTESVAQSVNMTAPTTTSKLRAMTDLRVPVQIRGAEQAGLDDARPGIQLDDRLDEGRLARSVLDTLNVDFLVLHLPMCSFACGGVIRSGRP